MRKLRFGLLLAVAAIAAAQPAAESQASTDNGPTFEVASIKFHPEPITFSADPAVRGRSMAGTASTLLDLITTAYGVRYDQISGGPAWLSSQLSHSAGRPVVDKTGLTGYYAFTLDWIPENRTPEPDSDIPTVFTAVQEQLGLKLEPAKAPYQMLIIDRAEKPSEN